MIDKRLILDNIESLKAVLPVILLAITGMLILLLDSCVPLWRKDKRLSGGLAIAGTVVAAFFAWKGLDDMEGKTRFAFQGAVTSDAFTHAIGLILLATAALSVLLGMTYLENRRLHLGEYYALVLFATCGAMLMASANDLIVLFVALETLSVALYVLAGFARTEEKSEEAALKYFLLGAFAAGFLLYGIALIYGGSAGAAAGGGGTTNLAIMAKSLEGAAPSPMLMTGIALLMAGLAFKAALVPFHMWTPDVYEGAPTSVTAFMSAAAKVAAFAAILRVFYALAPISEFWLPAVQFLAVVTMFGGNLLALQQQSVKRMFAYSSVAHAGYLMVAVAALANKAAHADAFRAAVFYLLSYSLMTIGSFGTLIWISKRGRDVQTLADLKGLGKNDSTAAYLLLIFLLSLGGIPPMSGFLGKWLIFNAAIQAGQTWLAVALAVASMISIFYYLKVVWTMFFQEPDETHEPERSVAQGGAIISLAVAAAGTLLFGLAPNLLHALMNVVVVASAIK